MLPDDPSLNGFLVLQEMSFVPVRAQDTPEVKHATALAAEGRLHDHTHAKTARFLNAVDRDNRIWTCMRIRGYDAPWVFHEEPAPPEQRSDIIAGLCTLMAAYHAKSALRKHA